MQCRCAIDRCPSPLKRSGLMYAGSANDGPNAKSSSRRANPRSVSSAGSGKPQMTTDHRGDDRSNRCRNKHRPRASRFHACFVEVGVRDRYVATDAGRRALSHGRQRQALEAFDCRQAEQFATIDTAGTSQQRPTRRRRANQPVSQCVRFGIMSPRPSTYLRHQWRPAVALGWSEVGVKEVLGVAPQRVLIGRCTSGPPLKDRLPGYTVELISPIPNRAKGDERRRPGKLERATG